jgi:hypothetical protein
MVLNYGAVKTAHKQHRRAGIKIGQHVGFCRRKVLITRVILRSKQFQKSRNPLRAGLRQVI